MYILNLPNLTICPALVPVLVLDTPDLAVSKLFTHGNVSSSDPPDEIHVRIEQHDVKVLNSLYGLDAPPILEPCHISVVHPVSENVVHEVLNFLPRDMGQVAGLLVLIKLELGPDYEMDDALVQTIGPVIVENLEVGGTGEWRTLCVKSGPVEEIILYVFEYGAVCLFEAVNVLPVAAEIGWDALKEVYAIRGWQLSATCFSFAC